MVAIRHELAGELPKLISHKMPLDNGDIYDFELTYGPFPRALLTGFDSEIFVGPVPPDIACKQRDESLRVRCSYGADI